MRLRRKFRRTHKDWLLLRSCSERRVKRYLEDRHTIRIATSGVTRGKKITVGEEAHLCTYTHAARWDRPRARPRRRYQICVSRKGEAFGPSSLAAPRGRIRGRLNRGSPASIGEFGRLFITYHGSTIFREHRTKMKKRDKLKGFLRKTPKSRNSMDNEKYDRDKSSMFLNTIDDSRCDVDASGYFRVDIFYVPKPYRP